MKKVFFVVLYFLNLKLTLAVNTASSEIKDWLLQGVNPHNNTIQLTSDWKSALTDVFVYIKDSVFSLLALIVIGTFLYIGYKIIMARWKPEEFKKAMLSLVYVVIWLVIVSLAWVIVKFIVGLNV